MKNLAKIMLINLALTAVAIPAFAGDEATYETKENGVVVGTGGSIPQAPSLDPQCETINGARTKVLPAAPGAKAEDTSVSNPAAAGSAADAPAGH